MRPALRYPALEADRSAWAALQDAPPYMRLFYDLLKSSYGTNAAALADLRSSQTATVVALAETSRVLADATPTLSSLTTRVDEVEQNQLALGAQLNTDLVVVHSKISRNTAADQAFLNLRSQEDPREIFVRGVPSAVRLEPLPLVAAFLTTLKLPQHVPLVVGYRAWNPLARAQPPELAALPTPRTPTSTDPPRAFVNTLACPAARDDVLKKMLGLKNLGCQAIFEAGGAVKLSVNALQPDPVHKLLKHETAKYKQLSHLDY